MCDGQAGVGAPAGAAQDRGGRGAAGGLAASGPCSQHSRQPRASQRPALPHQRWAGDLHCYVLSFCKAQGKGRAKGRPRKVTKRSFIDMDGFNF